MVHFTTIKVYFVILPPLKFTFWATPSFLSFYILPHSTWTDRTWNHSAHCDTLWLSHLPVHPLHRTFPSHQTVCVHAICMGYRDLSNVFYTKQSERFMPSAFVFDTDLRDQLPLWCFPKHKNTNIPFSFQPMHTVLYTVPTSCGKSHSLLLESGQCLCSAGMTFQKLHLTLPLWYAGPWLKYDDALL